jgi:hypothetical protein
VRYISGSRFPYHLHPGGEEILVLHGTFEDETGLYPAGSYMRNPPDSGHTPGSTGGCTIPVKLWQFAKSDQSQVRVLPEDGLVMASDSLVQQRSLYGSDTERVLVQRWVGNASSRIENRRGLEVYVLSGTFMMGMRLCKEGCWIRLPAGIDFAGEVGPYGGQLWVKDAPLLPADAVAFD